MLITQIRSKDETGTLSYLLSDENENVAAVIDPNMEDMEMIEYLTQEQGVNITHIIDTHTHADHKSGAGKLKELFNAKYLMHELTKNKLDVLKDAKKFGIEDILEANANIKIDEYVNEGDEIKVGSLKLKVLHTPGHTDNHMALLCKDAVFTGDLLLIGQAGRSDLPGGNPEDQYESLFNKIIPLPENTRIYPGHDYEDNEFSYLKDELVSNPFLQARSKEEYVEFVKDFFPPPAEVTSSGEKVTLQCGAKRVIKSNSEFKNITSEELFEMMNKNEDLYLLDVREPYELIMMGAVSNVNNIPIGELAQRVNELPEDKTKNIVCICASGNRSYEASHFLSKKGYENVMNLEGGTYGWLMNGYEVAKV